MRFVLLGFTQDGTVRNFRFQAITPETTPVEVVVYADLVLLRHFQIPTQELPLLCCQVLETRRGGEGPQSVTVTEEDMRQHAERRNSAKSEAARKGAFKTRTTGGILGSPEPPK
jgi:hypothetical protein